MLYYKSGINKKEKWDEYKKIIQVEDNLEFFKKSFFSRQKSNKQIESLNTIESITTIPEKSRLNETAVWSSNLNKEFDLINLENDQFSTSNLSKDEIPPNNPNQENCDQLPAICFKKV